MMQSNKLIFSGSATQERLSNDKCVAEQGKVTTVSLMKITGMSRTNLCILYTNMMMDLF